METAETRKICDAFGNTEDEPLVATTVPPVTTMASEQRRIIWTDGACEHQADPRIRRAGAGIFYGINHPMNLALPLPGKMQTNQRAELYAVIKAIERESRKLEIRSDSEYVVRGMNSFSSWKHIGWKGKMLISGPLRAPCSMRESQMQ